MEKKIIWALIKLMTSCYCITFILVLLSQKKIKHHFPQRAGRLRPSLWIFRVSLLFKRSFTKYWESYPGILGMMDLTPLHPHTAFHSYYGKGSHASFRFSKNFLPYKQLRITVLEKVILWVTRAKGLKEFWWQVGLTCAHFSSSSPPFPPSLWKCCSPLGLSLCFKSHLPSVSSQSLLSHKYCSSQYSMSSLFLFFIYSIGLICVLSGSNKFLWDGLKIQKHR